MKKKILICGATGFLGRNMAEHFANKDDFEVYGTHFMRPPLQHPRIKMLHVDLTDKRAVEEVMRGKDILVQAAATTSGSKDIVARPHIHVTDNAVMSSLIFRAAHEQKTPQIIFFSCSIMYQPGDTPVREDDFNPSEAMHEKYFGAGCTKVYLENIGKFYSERGNTKYTVIRHSNMYGPHDKYDLEKSHVFGATITKVMTNTDGVIKVWGTGEEERDLLHIRDLVNFVDLAVQKQQVPYTLVNVGYGSSLSVKELVQKIIAASGKKIRIEFDPNGPTIKTKLALNSERAKQIFGWTPTITLDQGIQSTIEWYRENIGAAA